MPTRWTGGTFVQRFGDLVVLVPDGVFVNAENRLAFALHPVPTSADVVAIRERVASTPVPAGRRYRVKCGEMGVRTSNL